MVDWSGFSIEGEKSVCTKGWEVKSRNNPVAPWCTSSWIWRKVEEDGSTCGEAKAE